MRWSYFVHSADIGCKATVYLVEQSRPPYKKVFSPSLSLYLLPNLPLLKVIYCRHKFLHGFSHKTSISKEDFALVFLSLEYSPPPSPPIPHCLQIEAKPLPCHTESRKNKREGREVAISWLGGGGGFTAKSGGRICRLCFYFFRGLSLRLKNINPLKYPVLYILHNWSLFALKMDFT